MSDKLEHDSDDMRRAGASNGAASAEPYQRAGGDPPWEDDIEEMFGNAALHFTQGTRKYMKVSSDAYTEIGDKRVGVENQSYSSATEFDNGDIDGAASVRRREP
ncbi:hypothetical protein OHA40_06300 [Nocardia sp. NBC_00508]|uniref:hypothetical protein n=1 Tax=Nocardia sp. NBC_00508 TaxID=2975992 RepID=UPI002E80DD98|nr:hypothetical protein [Nocardia sp. NBC_00508]WUD67737.1 hypothetical protein OHA40_06300 [Nocardia sp. NBC_00508]